MLNKQSLLARCKYLKAAIICAYLGNTKLQAAVVPVILAQGGSGGGISVSAALGKVIWLIMVIGFVMGVISVIAGAKSIDRGEEGKMKIVGGILTALAVPIMKAIYNAVVPEAQVDGIIPSSL